jgi:hypothetical protein
MIDPHTYSASFTGQTDQRTAGYMPVVGQKKAADAQVFSGLVRQAQDADPSTQAAKPAGEKKHHGFLDFLVTLFDIINPLEHIPIISTIYEHVTGHHMNAVARIAGDTLYGGPIGTAVGVANVIAEKKTGKDLGDNMLAMLKGKDNTDSETMVAQNAPRASDIIWNEASPPATAVAGPDSGEQNARLAMLAPKLKPNFPSLAAKPSHGATMAGKQLADYAEARIPPVHNAKGGITAAGSEPEGKASSVAADSTPGLSVQNAPAEAPERALPPGLIAQKMMAGLDKYAAMKKDHMAPGYSAVF